MKTAERTGRRRGGAFTLIELLIVVAIIAILAAIAVPNFLEAQTRSKVSRAKSDMRSIAESLEAYRTDYPNYPYSDNVVYGLPRVTTPIAYMSSLPDDPFLQNAIGWGDTGFIFDPSYCYYHSIPGGYPEIPGSADLYQKMQRNYLVNRLIIPEGGTQLPMGQHYQMQWEMRSPGPSRYYWYALPYDASNGTKSQGEIALFGPGNVGLGF